ncbi:MAG: penicillin-insensitive murein endopeptidase, partial [Myxococcales bacterium]|nr:penicillin-insensitive murein endopeptidase [Myxococcales bacterium]
ARYGVREAELLIWNPWLERDGAARPLRARMQLTIWAPSTAVGPGDPTRGPAIPEFSAPSSTPVARSSGRPHKGRLLDGAALPVNESLYTIRFERLAYGTALAVLGIQRALASFRHETAFPGPIYIGAMSRKSGRRLNPHKSHQSGRDVDVRLPAMPYAKHTQKLQEWEVDWHATWALIRAFAETGDVQQIFLEMKFWRRLRRAAVEMGSADAEIDAIMGKYVRHSRGHVAHIHVRFVCSEAAERCRD